MAKNDTGIDGLIKSLSDIMRQDAGMSANIQRIEQMSWCFFLKAYDAKEEEWELLDPTYRSLIPEECKWRSWAVKKRDTLTGDELLTFVNGTLFPTLKKLPVTSNTPMKQALPFYCFEDTNQYMKEGVLLRQVIDKIEATIDFEDARQRNIFGDVYEKLLKSLGEAKDSGEYYTPRAVTDFMIDRIAPVLGERVADFACGTGGFLTSALNYLRKQRSTVSDVREYSKAVYGIEKKQVPYLLCMTNLLIHDVDDPDIHHGNSLSRNVADYSPLECFDIIIMNPPYGGNEIKEIQNNFPIEFRSSETADLFLYLLMRRLKPTGRAGIVLPNSFLEATQGVKLKLKEKLFNEFNVDCIIRLPNDVFAPYTNIQTNLLFFNHQGPTKTTWFYRLDKPEGYKHFSKKKPMLFEHFQPALEWWSSREELFDQDGVQKAGNYTIAEIKERNYNLDLCGFPEEQVQILDPGVAISEYLDKRKAIAEEIDGILQEVERIMNTYE